MVIARDAGIILGKIGTAKHIGQCASKIGSAPAGSALGQCMGYCNWYRYIIAQNVLLESGGSGIPKFSDPPYTEPQRLAGYSASNAKWLGLEGAI